MQKYDYSLGAYKSGPRHIIIETDTRREVARCHNEEDLQLVLAALRAFEAAKQ